MTQLEAAKKGMISEEMKLCGRSGRRVPGIHRDGVVKGVIVVIRNIQHTSIAALAHRERVEDKDNANIGTSRDRVDLPIWSLRKGENFHRRRGRYNHGLIQQAVISEKSDRRLLRQLTLLSGRFLSTRRR